LKHQRIWGRRTVFPLLGFLFALLLGRAPTYRDLVEAAPFRFHPDVGITGKHRARDVAGDAHDHLVTGARLSEFRDQRVPVVVSAALRNAVWRQIVANSEKDRSGPHR
jgi:hypothetical protein